jgi:hypothetical protein
MDCFCWDSNKRSVGPSARPREHYLSECGCLCQRNSLFIPAGLDTMVVYIENGGIPIYACSAKVGSRQRKRMQ